MESTQALYTKMNAEIAQNPSLVFWPLQMMLKEIGYNWQERQLHSGLVLELMQDEPIEAKAAKEMNDLLGFKASWIGDKLNGRAQQVWDQVNGFVAGQSLLDFGCGDGRIAEMADRGRREVRLYDVADYRKSGLSLPFTANWQEVEGGFDTTLAIAVFHHCENPEKEIARLRQVTKRLIVIESVIDEAMPWATQAFVDWMYNRGLHPKAEIPVPGQFKKVQEWREVFAQNGFRVIHEQDLGIDLPVVPEHHHLFVLQ